MPMTWNGGGAGFMLSAISCQRVLATSSLPICRNTAACQILFVLPFTPILVTLVYYDRTSS